MPLYLVRWPNLSASIVRAEDRVHLLDILDEVDNAEGVKVWEYDGPLFIDMTLPTDKPAPFPEDSFRDPGRPFRPEEIEVGDLTRIARKEMPLTVIPETDTGFEMWDGIVSTAFPHLHQVLSEEPEYDESGEPRYDLEKVEAAIKQEATVAIEASWRWASVVRSDDPAAQVAANLGMSVELVKALRQRAGLGSGEDE